MRLRMRPDAVPRGTGGTGIRHLVPPHVLDAAIASAIAALGLASGFGARARLHTREEIPFYTGRRKPPGELIAALY